MQFGVVFGGVGASVEADQLEEPQSGLGLAVGVGLIVEMTCFVWKDVIVGGDHDVGVCGQEVVPVVVVVVVVFVVGEAWVVGAVEEVEVGEQEMDVVEES